MECEVLRTESIHMRNITLRLALSWGQTLDNRNGRQMLTAIAS